MSCGLQMTPTAQANTLPVAMTSNCSVSISVDKCDRPTRHQETHEGVRRSRCALQIHRRSSAGTRGSRCLTHVTLLTPLRGCVGRTNDLPFALGDHAREDITCPNDFASRVEIVNSATEPVVRVTLSGDAGTAQFDAAQKDGPSRRDGFRGRRDSRPLVEVRRTSTARLWNVDPGKDRA